MSAAAEQKPPDFAARLRDVRVGVREDLDVSRHVFRGKPCYILRDPLTFQSHRFDPADYEILVSIDAAQRLGDTFAAFVECGRLAEEDEQRFYQFVFQLHQMGFLKLPIADDKVLYRRYQARQKAKARQRITGILFMQVPLWDPAAFLNRTMRYARPLFSRWFFLLWLVTVSVAIGVLAVRWGDVLEPLNGLLAARNLGLIWITLVVLKIFHEFGHAYACKNFGGHVPEMGAYFIAFTPCAYVDATASWGFSRKRERLIVCLGGMYVEVFIAALAVFVWVLTGPSLLNALAYNVIFLAGVTTVLFNVNPLMRFDGYYVASDLLEIPNLRSRSSQYVLECLKRIFLGIRTPRPPESRSLRATLLVFGVCASIYRLLVLTGIAALIAVKFLVLGLLLAGVFLTMFVVNVGRKLHAYLWHADETAPVRRRAVATGLAVAFGLPVALALVPLRTRVTVGGVVAGREETVVRAETAGFVTAAPRIGGETVTGGDLLVALENAAVRETLLEVEAEIEAARIRRDAYRLDQPAIAQQETQRLESLRFERDRRARRVEALSIRAPTAGAVVATIRETDIGRFINIGEPLATIVSGQWRIRVQLTEDQMSACQPRIGDEIVFRSKAAPGRSIPSVIERIRPAGARAVDAEALTHAGGGDIVVSKEGATREPYFEIIVAPQQHAARFLRHGLTGRVQFTAGREPIGLFAYRRVLRFIDALSQG